VGKREYAKIVGGYIAQPTIIGRSQRTNSCHSLRIVSSPMPGAAMSVPFALSKGPYP
jgi:hypothetical protein